MKPDKRARIAIIIMEWLRQELFDRTELMITMDFAEVAQRIIDKELLPPKR